MIKSSIIIIISSLWLLLLTGCAANQMNAPSVEAAEPPVSHLLCQHRIRLLTESLCHATQHPPVVHKKLAKKWGKTAISAPTLTDGFATVQYQPDQQPIIQAAPFQITVIQLEPGEKFTNISSGDPSRWSYAVATSGKEDNAQQNILLKPSLPDISTNLVITTDKRLYNVRLMSSQTDKLTRNVSFWYPEETAQTQQNCVDDEADMQEWSEKSCSPVQPDHYRISTAGLFSRPPDWQPLRVFEDGVHTYIQFPDNIGQRDLPVLLASQNGEVACVNYRFKAPYMVVDNLLTEATLVSGVGQSQQAVRLTHTSV